MTNACPPSSFGLSRSDYDSSFWTISSILPSSCLNLQIAYLAIFAILALLITFANVLVILVLSRDNFYHNSYGIYKMNLAIADLMVGLIVLPCLIGLRFHVMFNVKLPWREYGQVPNSADYFDQRTLDVLGFFNVFSLCISILTLTFSSFDRYLAVRFPMKYKNSETGVKILTVVFISIVWILGILFAITPWLKDGMRYVLGPSQLVIGIIPGSDEDFPLTDIWTEIFYAAIIVAPLLVVWIVNSATIWEIIGDDCFAFFRTLFCCKGRFCNTRAPRESRRPSAFGHVSKKHQKQSFEIRIAKTFLSMTAAFTLSLLPMGLVNLWFFLNPDSTNPNSLHFNPRLSAAREFFDLLGNFC
ncbi:unnamed protein product [Oikopleura dioica]|uniref:G-protein coupled receptors family 1 profile domain-containing protein n=1 Tax=Oikopleura dioica TaxID=34765 RepID=E4XQN9_OIKDI|nr:unnamed protein product [Oikopleura dioica]